MNLLELVSSEIAPFIKSSIYMRRLSMDGKITLPDLSRKKRKDGEPFSSSEINRIEIPIPSQPPESMSYGSQPGKDAVDNADVEEAAAETHSLDLSRGKVREEELDSVKAGDKVFFDGRPLVITKLKMDFVHRKATFKLQGHEDVTIDLV
jgi:hypothetical protein